VAIAVAGLVVLSLAYIHPLVEIAIVALAPGLVALAFSGGARHHFRRYANAGAIASGVTGAAWLIATAEPGENVPAVLIGAMVSALLLVALAAAGAWAIDRLQVRRSAWDL
jgi:hypothetical protein